MNRIRDFLLMEEEFIQNQEKLKPAEETNKADKALVDEIRGYVCSVRRCTRVDT